MYSEWRGEMMSNKDNETNELLLKEIKQLNEKISKLETDIEDIKFFTPKPILNTETIGTIGGLILGALVIIGIFY